MTDKITLLPRMVRGLGNIVMAKTVDNFLPRTGRVMQDTDTVNGINRTVFRVQHEGVSMTPVYLDVTAPSVVDVSAENITFTVALKKESDDSVVTGQTVKYLIDDEINEVSTGSSGTVTVTVPNTFETGTHTITFLFNTISSYSGCYRVVNITVGDGELELELLPVKTVFGSGTVVPILAKLTTAGSGVKDSVVYFWERYISSVLRLFLPSVVRSGGTVSVSASFRDSDGSAIKDAVVYFWERYIVSGLRFSAPSAFQGTVDLLATVVDEDGSRVKGETVDLYEVKNFRFSWYPAGYWLEPEPFVYIDYFGPDLDGETVYLELKYGDGTVAYSNSIIVEYSYNIFFRNVPDPTRVFEPQARVWTSTGLDSGPISTFERVLDGYGAYFDNIVSSQTTNGTGTANLTLTGTGTGKRYFYTKVGTIQSETYEIIDAIYYDTCTMDTSSRYSVNTSVGNTIEFDENDECLVLTVGSSNRYVATDTNQSAFTLSDYTGKSIRFKVDVNPSRSCALQIVQVVDGQNQVTTSDYVNSQSTISIDANIDSNATRIQFRVLANGTGATTGDTVNINNWTIYEI